MTYREAAKCTLPIFQKLTLCDKATAGANVFQGQERLHYRPKLWRCPDTDELTEARVNLFPMVTEADGRIWQPAFLYLADRVFSQNRLEMATHHNVAEDLVIFKRFLDRKNIRFDDFDSSEPHELPTYRYRNFLQKQLNSDSVPASTGKRRLQSMVSFYRFLFEKKIVVPKNSPWIDKKFRSTPNERQGFEND